MKYINTILSNVDVDNQTKEVIMANYTLVNEKRLQMNINFENDNAEMVFCNHIVSLIRRILAQEYF